ncbi:MAG: hypothetical protein KF819_38115 [Labilithrix sp.]|nr:hypothetical protein [Labilithrix sp.]
MPRTAAHARTLRDVLPSVYESLLSDVFDRPEIVESRATCSDCAMCDKGQEKPIGLEHFLPDTKCCTFHPTLPNYLVGGLLSDTSGDVEEGKRRMRERIASRIGVTPQWVAPPKKMILFTAAARDSGFFGRSRAYVCPYYDPEGAGRCTIWKHREVVCTTYFCRYVGGKPAWEFWKALRDYMGFVEMGLSSYLVSTIDPKLAEPKVGRAQLTIEDLEDRAPNDEAYAKCWSKWVGREEEVYVACAEKVRSIRREEFAHNIDSSPKGRELLANVATSYENIGKETLPERLVRNPRIKPYPTQGKVVVTTYNTCDPISVDQDLYDALGLLMPDQPLDQSLARLEKEQGVELAPDLLRYLFVHGVLVAPAAQAEAAESKQAGGAHG